MKNAYTKQSDGTTLIHCWHGGKTVNAIIDSDDLSKLDGWSFMVSRENDVKGDRHGEYRQLKQLILNVPKGTKASHLNGNKLDCRKSNLHPYGANVHPTKFEPVTGTKYDAMTPLHNFLAEMNKLDCKLDTCPDCSNRIAKLQWLARELTTEINLLANEKL